MKYFFSLLIFLLVSCSNIKRQPQVVAFNEPVLIDSIFLDSLDLKRRNLVVKFYETNNNELIWSLADSSKTKSADSLLQYVLNAEQSGLIATDYHAAELKHFKNGKLTPRDRRLFDAFLTDAYFTLWSDLQHGRVDIEQSIRKVYHDSIDEKSINVLRATIQDNRIIHSLEQNQKLPLEYFVLKDTLTQLLQKQVLDSTDEVKRKKLIVTLERLRSATTKPDRYLEVNIPAFMLYVHENDSVVLASNIIVGKPDTRTPLLSSVIKSFIIYPYWHVPRSIATKELLPLIKSDTNYLKSHNFEVLDKYNSVIDASTVDWKSLHEDYFPYVLRQREGNENSLGIIKFVFQNEYGVYLHDTNGRRLFSKKYRALSHGCVRVQKAIELAHYLVKEDSVYITPEDLDQYLQMKQKVQVKVINPLPLFIDYKTCEYKNGSVFFYDDVYNKDEVIFNILYPEQQQDSVKVL